ncbi:hypothetical protein HXX76_009414 [Chlamydomonas incerta]|uniref:Hexosyltransferase n=1 Tax=Chlamydomonas incerta TaxID=51695 RepID=A0A835VZH8_CHLIN|nr:hypothetical protein HXX76_009414 [Chlamydomonas incerta]|eukprot:KAG2431399.1 hypothetical protein HXX76_009414 [Chlamydomonas incerta]
MAYGKDDAERTRYKWMLLGDDDTIWVLPAVLRMINERKLAHTEPHLISDYHYHCRDPHVPCLGPHNFDPRCLPCSPGTFCPCRLPPGCALKDFYNYTDCPYKEIVAAYGGGGIIFSQALIQQLFSQPDFYWALVTKRVTSGTPAGDLVLGEAPRQLGVGYTRLFYDDPQRMPPAGPPPPPVHDTHTGDRLFGTWSQFNDHAHPNDVFVRHEAAAHEHPDLFRQMVTVHVRSRNFYGIPWNLTELFVAYEKIVHLLHRMHNVRNHTGPGQGGLHRS